MTNPKECVTKCLTSSEQTGDRRLVSDIVQFVNAVQELARLQQKYRKVRLDLGKIGASRDAAYIRMNQLNARMGAAESEALLTIMKKTGVI